MTEVQINEQVIWMVSIVNLQFELAVELYIIYEDDFCYETGRLCV